MLFCGIDLYMNNCFVVISDDDDRALYSRRLPNNLTEICTALDPYRTDMFGVVVESTYNWYWLVDGLIDAGYSLHLANTTAIKQYDGLKHRGDESDARHLAHILRLGLLPDDHIADAGRSGSGSQTYATGSTAYYPDRFYRNLLGTRNWRSPVTTL